MLFPIRSLAEGAVQVDSSLAPDDEVWMEGDIRPTAGIRVTGRISGAGSGRFYFSGAFQGIAAGECRRCLVPVETPVRGNANLLFADAEDENADEPDIYPIGELGTMLDLRPAIREQWLLEASDLPLCRPDCKGLCPSCGADLNAGDAPHECPVSRKKS